MLAEATICLALTVFHEARGEPLSGRIAVAFIPVTRARKNNTSICWEVFKPNQFSWTLYPEKRKTLPAGREWQDAVFIADSVLRGQVKDFTKGADHFDTGKPGWSRGMIYMGKWGNHTFWKSKK